MRYGIGRTYRVWDGGTARTRGFGLAYARRLHRPSRVGPKRAGQRRSAAGGGQQAEQERSTRTRIPAPTWTSGLGQLLAVVIARVANDGVNVMGAPLRRVLDQQRRTLDAVVGSAPLDRRPVPGKVGFIDFGLER